MVGDVIFVLLPYSIGLALAGAIAGWFFIRWKGWRRLLVTGAMSFAGFIAPFVWFLSIGAYEYWRHPQPDLSQYKAPK